MKLDIKTISLTILLGSLYFFISNKTDKKLIKIKTQPDQISYTTNNLIDNNLPKITTAKPLYLVPTTNFIGLGGNYKSKN